MSLYVGDAWAVRINVNEHMPVAWLNPGGGYSAHRSNRKLWADYSDAAIEAAKWSAHEPRIVHVLFRASQAPGTTAEGDRG